MELERIDPIKSEVEKRISAMGNLAIAPSNATAYETLRKDNNSYIKLVKGNIEKAKEEYLKPFDEKANELLEAIKPLEEANKKLSAEILEAKKKRFELDMRHEWETIAMPDENGEVVPFESVYDPSWYSKTKQDAKELMAKRLKWEISKKRKVQACIILDCTKEELKAVKDFVYENRISADISEIGE